MRYEDLDDPPMSPISFQSSPLPTQSSPVPTYTPVLPSSLDWNEDMLPVSVQLDPESHLEIRATLQAQEVSAHPLVMIDSGATSTFINRRLVESLGLTLTKKTHPRPLFTVDGSQIKGGSVKFEVLVQLSLGHHQEDIVLDVVDIGRHDIILGTPWLTRHNPAIDWTTHLVTFTSLFCSKSCFPMCFDV